MWWRSVSHSNPMAEGGPVCIFRSPKFLLKFVIGTTSKPSKWPPNVILKNLFVNMFCTSWPIFMIKIPSRGFFKVLNRLERVLIWPEIRIMRNSKCPPFLLWQILLLFKSRFIIDTVDTGSPWARICHHAPPPLSTLIRGVLGMFIAMLRGITLSAI